MSSGERSPRSTLRDRCQAVPGTIRSVNQTPAISSPRYRRSRRVFISAIRAYNLRETADFSARYCYSYRSAFPDCRQPTSTHSRTLTQNARGGYILYVRDTDGFRTRVALVLILIHARMSPDAYLRRINKRISKFRQPRYDVFRLRSVP